MTTALENAVEAVERDPVRLAAESSERRASRRVWVALVVSPTVEVGEALLRGESVPVDALDRAALARFLPPEGEPPPATSLDDLPSVASTTGAALRVGLDEFAPSDLPAIEAKAGRLLVEGRVRLIGTPDGLEATVEGDHSEYVVRLTRRGPSCDCPAYVRRCSHVRAVELVTGTRPEEVAA